MRKKWDKNNIYQDKDYQLSKTDRRHYVMNLRSPIIIRKFTKGRKERRVEGRREKGKKEDQTFQLSISL